MVKEIIQTGTMHDEFREILKFDFRVHGKVPFLISLSIYLNLFWGAYFHQILSLKLQHSKKNLFEFEELNFYEVTLQFSCKKEKSTTGTKK